MITFTLKDPPPVPLEAESLTPDTIAPLTIDAVRALPVNLGKHRRRLADFFTVEGTPGDDRSVGVEAASLASAGWTMRSLISRHS